MTQFGFRKTYSTIHPILHIVTESYDSMNDKKYSSLIFLDIKKAYDSVCHKKLLFELHHYGIRGVSHQLFKSYLSHRKQLVNCADAMSNPVTVQFGVPQRSILGPLLFLLYINDLPNCVQTIPRFFADDTALLITHDTPEELKLRTNSELARISEWMLCNTPTLNTSKTNALFFTSYLRKPNLAISFTLNHTIIHSTSTARYLGVLLDDKLKFDAHLAFLEYKLSRSVGIIFRLSRYLPTKTLLTLYYSLVHRPTHLLYALPIWASTYDTYLIKIQRLQDKAIRILTKCRISDRITPRFHDLQILKVNDVFKHKIGKLMYQCTNKKLHEHFNDYFTYMSKVLSYSTRNNVTNQIALP